MVSRADLKPVKACFSSTTRNYKFNNIIKQKSIINKKLGTNI